MTDQMDRLLQELSELRQAVEGAKGDKSTLDTDALAQAVAEKATGLLQEQAKQVAPVRRGEEIEPEGQKAPAVDNAYKGVDAVDLYLTHKVLSDAARLGFSKGPSERLTKALSSTGTGTGDEYVPTDFAMELWQDFRLNSLVGANIPGIAMPTNPFELPVGWGDVTWYKGAENASATASDPATSKKTLTATKQIASVLLSYELDEDAVIAVMPTLRAELGVQGGEQIDRFLLRADSTDAATGNINSDDADPAATAWFLSDGEDGIIHQWIVDNTAQAVNAGGDALTDVDMAGAIAKIGKYSIDVNNTVIFVEPKTYVAMMGLTNVVTVDKYGPNATILTGELARYRGLAVVPTPAQYLAQADGKQSDTASNNTLGTLSIVHRPSWRHGFRRELLIEVDRDIQKQQNVMVVSFRLAAAARGTRSAATHTSGVYNILV